MSRSEERGDAWIIARERVPRVLLRAELLERGFVATGYETITDAVSALKNPYVLPPRAIVLELKGQVLRRDLLRELKEAGLPVIILGGAVELNNPVIKGFQWEEVMARPFTIGAVADRVEKLLKEGPHGRSKH